MLSQNLLVQHSEFTSFGLIELDFMFAFVGDLDTCLLDGLVDILELHFKLIHPFFLLPHEVVQLSAPGEGPLHIIVSLLDSVVKVRDLVTVDNVV